ncbi:hypothetical protein HDU96_001827, partial [Phlyctochytrium bullatum]
MSASANNFKANTDDPFTLFHATHLDAKVITAVLQVLQEHLGPNFRSHDPSHNFGDASNDSDGFVLSISVPKKRSHHGGTMALMGCMMRDASGDGTQKRKRARLDSESPEEECVVGSVSDSATAATAPSSIAEIAHRVSQAVAGSQGIPVGHASGSASGTSDTWAMEVEVNLSGTGSETSTVPCHADNLHEAASQNDIQAIEKLLSAGADPYAKNADGRLPIQMTTVPAVWKAFSTQMPFPATDTLWGAAKRGDGVAVRLFLAKGVDASETGPNGFTAMHLAAKGGHEDVVKVLLDCGGPGILATRASPTDGDTWLKGFTPLHIAAASNHSHIIHIVAEAGANLESFVNEQRESTPLHIAAMHGGENAAQALIARGANLFAETAEKRTPLH